MNKILVVEPYYGGSHHQFLLGVQKVVPAEFTLLTLPARKWKMRMQVSAPWFAKSIAEMADCHFDTLLCSTFVDVAVLRALLTRVHGWNDTCRVCTYFHENQFAYPTRFKDKAMHQFTAINFTTALASDSLAFNSNYNLKTFLSGINKFINRAADVDLRDIPAQIEEKSTVLYPGLDYEFQPQPTRRVKTAPVICWNHRWEHDKNPEEFFKSLGELADQGYDFKLIILGQSFNDAPAIFHWAREKFASRIIHCGYAASREEYFNLLQQGDIVVSTAFHEFFGISMMEAVGSGCIPLVPDRLSYPELYPRKFQYGSGQLTARLKEFISSLSELRSSVKEINPLQFSWSALQDDYIQWLNC